MRTFLVALVVALGMLAAPALTGAPLVATAGAVSAVDLDQQTQPVQPPSGSLDVNINTDGDAWYTNPVWIAIGVVAVILIIALIVMAGRGGGTTVVRG